MMLDTISVNPTTTAVKVTNTIPKINAIPDNTIPIQRGKVMIHQLHDMTPHNFSTAKIKKIVRPEHPHPQPSSFDLWLDINSTTLFM